MLAQPSLIKRPVVELGGGKLLVGFKPEFYSEASPALAKRHAETTEPDLREANETSARHDACGRTMRLQL